MFDNEAYWDVTVEYAKADVNDTCIVVTANIIYNLKLGLGLGLGLVFKF